MKKIYYVIALILLSMSACSTEGYESVDSGTLGLLYVVQNGVVNNVKTVEIDSEKTYWGTIGLYLGGINEATEDIPINVTIDADKLTDFNNQRVEAGATAYLPLPANALTFDEQVTIKAGEIQEVCHYTINTSVLQPGVSYMFVATVTTTSAMYKVNKSLESIYLLIKVME